MTTQALKLALDYIQSTADYKMGHPAACEAAFDLREALAEDALQRLSDIHQEMEQQPVAYIGMIDKDHFADVCRKANGNSNTPLYAAPPQQEPVAWMADSGTCATPDERMNETYYHIPLYTSPPQRTWVGLTEADWKHLYDEFAMGQELDEFAEAIEAKLKAKND